MQIYFFRYDSSSTADGRFLIWIAESKKNHYNKFSVLLIDATFKMCPQSYYQMAVVMTKIFNRFYPLAYILMSNKTEELYKMAFVKLRELIELYPERIITDFEPALTKSLNNVFNSTLSGCFFHFSQMIWRKIQNFGLVNFYKQNKDFKKIVKKLILISFCSESTFLSEFESLEATYCVKYNTIEQKEFLKYYKENFITKSDDLSVINPRFSFDFWSSHYSILLDLPYTNNILESWNKNIRERSRHDHPNIAYWRNILLDIEADNIFQITRAKNGIMDWGSTSFDKSNKIKIIVENELNFSDNGFLEALSSLFLFNFD